MNPESSLLFITPRLPLQLAPISLSSGCEEVTPVHLRSVHTSTSSADARQLPGNDCGDCERSRTQDPLGCGQTHSFSWCRLKRGLCDCCVCHLSSGRQPLSHSWWSSTRLKACYLNTSCLQALFNLQGDDGSQSDHIDILISAHFIFLLLNVFHLFVLLPVVCIKQCFCSLVLFSRWFSNEIYVAFLCSKMTFIQVLLPSRM